MMNTKITPALLLAFAALGLASCDDAETASQTPGPANASEDNQDAAPAGAAADLASEPEDYAAQGQWLRMNETHAASLGLTGQTRVLQLLPEAGYNVVMVKTDCAKGTYAIPGSSLIKSAPSDAGTPAKPGKPGPIMPSLASYMDQICGLAEKTVYQGAPNSVATKLRQGAPTSKVSQPIPGAERITEIKKMPRDNRPSLIGMLPSSAMTGTQETAEEGEPQEE